MKKEITYAQAAAEIEELLAKINDPAVDIDQVGSYVERAAELIALCQERLLRVQHQVEQILEKQ